MNTAEDTQAKALVTLRVSLARIAQAVSIQTPDLPVLDKSFSELHCLAIMNDRGWNVLASRVFHTLSNKGESNES
jgi:hypothetical protein